MYIFQLALFLDTAKQQRAAAHITAPDEFGRHAELLTGDMGQDIEILAAGNAAEKDDFATGANLGDKFSHVAEKRTPIERILLTDRHAGKTAKLRQPNGHIAREKACGRRDYQDAVRACRRAGEGPRVREFAAKIKRAQETENLSQGSSFGASQPRGEIRSAVSLENPTRSLAVAIRR